MIYSKICLIQTLWGDVKLFELQKVRIMRVFLRSAKYYLCNPLNARFMSFNHFSKFLNKENSSQMILTEDTQK